jgi:hypothetical protein
MIRSLTRVALVAAIAIPSLGLSASSAKAQTESVSFTLVNGTTSTMTHFYSSPTTDTHWGEDILDQDVLYSGESATITIDDGEDSCEYHFKAVFDDGTESLGSGTICGGETYTYTD